MTIPETTAAGLYESLRTSRVEELVRKHTGLTPSYLPVPESEVPDVLARHVREVINHRLAELGAGERLDYTNRLLQTFGTEADILIGLDQLVALHDSGDLTERATRRPITPLSRTKLLTNTPGEPGIGQELERELESADRVELLCAFIRFAGIRVIRPQLDRLRERGVPLRVITTTYTGSTERRALDMLVRQLGADVKVSYDVSSTRLHAKAWLIKRHSGYDTGFVGSSNLTKTAMLDGVEWNIRISAVATPDLVRKFEATFETYWNTATFEAYDPDRDADRFDTAVARAGTLSPSPQLTALDVRPFPHQVAALEALAADREVHDQHRNLVVAATGTGKTMLAALDYRRLCAQDGARLRLLFVAHRKEILEHAMTTYRQVLGRGDFGELLVGGDRPTEWRHVFGSVQSVTNTIDALPTNAFDVIVIDEFHHAGAATYRRILDHFRPKELLGLTATPERTDGLDVRDIFNGRATFEVRLWDALEQDLLCPFHYFGISDNTDLTGIEWSRGQYSIDALTTLYTGNDARARLVLTALHDQVTDSQATALGFCVSIAHAQYMSRVFNEAGIAATVIAGTTSAEERTNRLGQWRAGTFKIIFCVDVFNEGVDVPEIDTILMLRPTESSTLFQQQLGRGLRKSPNKAVLTVLDFIGQHRREFRFADRYRAITGEIGRSLERHVSEDFPFLPSGTRIILDRVSKEVVLDNVRAGLRRSRTELVRDLRQMGDVPLDEYLDRTGRSPIDIYRSGRSWTELRWHAGFAAALTAEEQAVAKRLGKFLIIDDPGRASAYRVLASPDGPSGDSLGETHTRYGQMLMALLWSSSWRDMPTLDAGLARLRALPRMVRELQSILDVALGQSRHLTQPLNGGLTGVPLMSHATYHREEVLAALGWAKLGGRSPSGHSTGVLWAPEAQTDALFVTLRKDESAFSPQTMYRDYPISLSRFHWESQHATDEDSPTGRRFVNHQALETAVLLFVRINRKGELGSEPYVCLGHVSYREHRGSQPMGITWDLQRSMPGEILSAGTVVA